MRPPEWGWAEACTRKRRGRNEGGFVTAARLGNGELSVGGGNDALTHRHFTQVTMR